jgi:predicted permease
MPGFLRRLRSVAAALFRRRSFEDAMAEELRFHQEAHAADLRRQGYSAAEAARLARLELGATESIKEDCRQSRGLQAADELRQDLRYAWRQMRRAPLFTAAALVSLALGIGATTAIVTLMDAVIFREIVAREPDRLFYLGHGHGDGVSLSANVPLLTRYREAGVLDGVAAYHGMTFGVRIGDAAVIDVEGQYVSGNYHGVIGVPFAAGHGFVDEPDRPGGAIAVVISDAFWGRRFGRRPDAVGTVLVVNGRPATIVGVTAPAFWSLRSGSVTDLTLPFAAREIDQPGFLTDRTGWIALSLIGRLRAGQTPPQAEAALSEVFRQYWFEAENAWVRTSPEAARERAIVLPANRGSGSLRSEYNSSLAVLLAMVAVILCIACANVANLLLARAAARSREIAIRLGIGAGRARLVRQLLTESLLLAVLGGIGGLAVAALSVRAILALMDTGPQPLVLDAAINLRVLAVTLGIAVVTGIAFGLIPALRATRADLTPSLRWPGVSVAVRDRTLVGKSLLIGQIALSMVVLTGAGLLGRSLSRLQHLDAGFAREHIGLVDVKTVGTAFTEDRRTRLYPALLARVQAMPGVMAAALADRSPIDFSSQERRIDIEGFPPASAGVSSVVVTPGYFATLGIDLIRGRHFLASDRNDAPTVAIVNESMARRYFGDRDPLGHVVTLGGRRDRMTIVGVVRDARHEFLREDAPRTVYVPLAQPGIGFDGQAGLPWRLTVLIRTAIDPRQMLAIVPDLVKAIDADALATYPRTMTEQLDAALIPERLLGRLSMGFAVLALLLAAVGVYGVMAYRVSRTARETAIRMTLGATKTAVLWNAVRTAAAISLAGVAIGGAVALMASNALAGFLFAITPRDPIALTMAAAILMGAAIAASLVPARRAASVDPVRALKAE